MTLPQFVLFLPVALVLLFKVYPALARFALRPLLEDLRTEEILRNSPTAQDIIEETRP
jgi:hypothetical protein